MESSGQTSQVLNSMHTALTHSCGYLQTRTSAMVRFAQLGQPCSEYPRSSAAEVAIPDRGDGQARARVDTRGVSIVEGSPRPTRNRQRGRAFALRGVAFACCRCKPSRGGNDSRRSKLFTVICVNPRVFYVNPTRRASLRDSTHQSGGPA